MSRATSHRSAWATMTVSNFLVTFSVERKEIKKKTICYIPSLYPKYSSGLSIGARWRTWTLLQASAPCKSPGPAHVPCPAVGQFSQA